MEHSTSSKDYLFSRAMVRQLWEAGIEDVRRSCAHPQWRSATETVAGVRVFDLAELNAARAGLSLIATVFVPIGELL